MDITAFKSISMNGRMAYALMCAERYLKHQYPNKNWRILSQLFWKVTSDYWDEWDYHFVEIIPECLLEKGSWQDSSFDYLTESDYKKFAVLYDGTGKDVNELLMLIHELASVYMYTSIPGYGKESLQILQKIAGIAEKKEISIPSPDVVSFSSFSEKNGWGEQFNSEKFSLFL